MIARQGLSSSISHGLFLQVYFHQGGEDRKGTNIARVFVEFTEHIFWYNSRLSWHRQVITGINRILNPRCMLWGWNIPLSASFVVLFAYSIDLGKFSSLSIANNLFMRSWDLIALGSYLSTDVDGNILIVSVTMLSNPVIFWILVPNSSILSLHHITCWDSLGVVAYTWLLWYENTWSKENSSELIY